MRSLVTALAVAGAGAASLPASAAAAFPGANGQTAFERASSGSTTGGDIFTIGPQGEDPTPLTANPDNDLDPSYSADGEKIVFLRSAEDTIWVMNADGSGQTQLTGFSPVTDDGNPAFSPDGSRIVFERGDASDTEIWVMNADGTGQSQLTDNAQFDLDPSFSPDGQKIVFSRTGGSFGQILVMNADGQNQTPLTNAPGNVDTDPDYSPDGTRIAFSRNDTGGNIHIYAMGADGQNPTPLTSDPAADTEPAFSPDGTRIAFARGGGMTSAGLFSIDAAGQTPATPLTGLVSGQFDTAPSWQPLNPPSCDLSGEPKQRSPKAITTTVTCTENTSVSASGQLAAPKPKLNASKSKTVTLNPATIQVPANAPTQLTLTVPKKGKKLLKKALKAGKKPKGSVAITATDDLGATTNDSFAVKLKRKKK